LRFSCCGFAKSLPTSFLPPPMRQSCGHSFDGFFQPSWFHDFPMIPQTPQSAKSSWELCSTTRALPWAGLRRGLRPAHRAYSPRFRGPERGNLRWRQRSVTASGIGCRTCWTACTIDNASRAMLP
jgi:hypothetical protein